MMKRSATSLEAGNRKRAKVEGPVRPGRSAPGANRVRFSGQHLPAALENEPGHRHGSPSRPSMRTPSPAKRTRITRAVDQDEKVCKIAHGIREDVFALASKFKAVDQPLNEILSNLSVETCRYIECLVIPDRNGRQFWADLFGGPNVPNLVAALIGRALQEHVLTALYFGGTDEQLDRLEQSEQEQFSHALARVHARANVCQSFERSNDNDQVLRTEQQRMAVVLLRLISPLYMMGRKVAKVELIKTIFLPLLRIVERASLLNRAMRQDGSTLWQWTETFKDTRFDPGSTECTNLVNVFETTSYAGREGGATVFRPGHEDRPDPIVRIIVFPGLVAWRIPLLKPTADAGQHPARQPRHESERRIMKNVAVVEWSRQRALTQTAGSAHHQDLLAAGKADDLLEDADGAVDLWDLWQEHRSTKGWLW